MKRRSKVRRGREKLKLKKVWRRTSSACSERKSLLEWKCLRKTSSTVLSSHRVWKTQGRNVRFFSRGSDLSHNSTHLHAGVPVLREPVTREVVWQTELGSKPLHELGERRAAQQVDLTVGEPRLDPFLQQLQNILEGEEFTSF